jgi:hypothetical protein
MPQRIRDLLSFWRPTIPPSSTPTKSQQSRSRVVRHPHWFGATILIPPRHSQSILLALLFVLTPCFSYPRPSQPRQPCGHPHVTTRTWVPEGGATPRATPRRAGIGSALSDNSLARKNRALQLIGCGSGRAPRGRTGLQIWDLLLPVRVSDRVVAGWRLHGRLYGGLDGRPGSAAC